MAYAERRKVVRDVSTDVVIVFHAAMLEKSFFANYDGFSWLSTNLFSWKMLKKKFFQGP